MPETPRILVVDDELPIAEAIAYNLKKAGYQVQTAADAETCLRIARASPPSLIILDIMLPSISGFDVCRLLRQHGDVPIIMLTARTAEMDRVKGLELGADDYVTKPFNMRELLARVKSVLRRSMPSQIGAEALEAGDLVIDVARHEVRLRGNPLNLAPKEFELLRYLVAHTGRVFTRQQLLDRVWGTDAFVDERTVDVHIRWLREKIEDDPSHPRYLLTVRGVGYKFAG